MPTDRLRKPVPPVTGLVLAGGESRRMGRDKAAIKVDGATQLERTAALLSRRLPAVFVGVRESQRSEPLRARFPQVLDAPPPPGVELSGPIAGLLGAFAARPDHAWLVVACDLPRLDDAAIADLLAGRDAASVATAFTSAHDGLPEPLCAIWEPAAAAKLLAHVAGGNLCPRKFLLRNGATLLPARASVSVNVNTPAELAAAVNASSNDAGTSPAALRPHAMSNRYTLQYFAVLREQARCRQEQVVSAAATPDALYAEVRARHGFHLEPAFLRVAVNEEFADWHMPLKDGDRVVFIPPVAGG